MRSMMENELDIMDQRHEESLGIYEKASSYAPAFGMIGTLVGLVNMLMSMDMDSGGIGGYRSQYGDCFDHYLLWVMLVTHLFFADGEEAADSK